METLSQSSRLECQICFNPFSLQRRRPKMLQCRHTCCSVCLSQMRLNHREIRCPWCRSVTPLPSSLSVSQLPDDLEALSVISVMQSSEHVPVYIRLPGNGCYLLPLPGDVEQALLPEETTYRFDFKGGNDMALPGQSLEVEVVEEEEVGVLKSSAWTGFCTVLLVAVILIFLLGIVLHNMSCVSKRFSIISCG
ncbi:E3 ubiquitin-protein ligase rnf152 [Pygocentrus nattereri]|uniref:RING-type E3 ubiquitin transferase n=1 Tax=Pygocentrus nattereri TaxID=42514 RepID=A0A3B4CY46_PYGNA|nr:E3 ubiquitin-protein ligase rnf152 [Pygocentrus nattereri]XP_017561471.1 E3 ubiquitin-protein ligase rnf152 [Pygocentrus nattereri]